MSIVTLTLGEQVVICINIITGMRSPDGQQDPTAACSHAGLFKRPVRFSVVQFLVIGALKIAAEWTLTVYCQKYMDTHIHILSALFSHGLE